ncbi:MAG: NUDIX hydrolase [Verrucomicrobiota bacterium]
MKRIWRFAQTLLGLVLRHPVTGTSIIAVLPDGRIVLIQRRDNGLWSLPGGMVDWGENIPTTVKRELAEETGLELVEITRLVGVYSAPDRDPRLHSICVAVEAHVKGDMQVRDPHEVMAVQAFTPAGLPKGLAHDHDRQLQDYFSKLTVLA